MADLALPVARSWIICEDIVTDPDNPGRVCLMWLTNRIRGTGSPPFPLVHPELCVFGQLTACRGRAELWAEIRHADDDAIVFRTRRRTHTFPNDPLRVHGLRFRMLNLLFLEPGLYWVQLWCNDRMLAQNPLTLS